MAIAYLRDLKNHWGYIFRYNKNANFAGMFLIELEALEVLFAGPVPLSVFMFTNGYSS